MTGGGVRADRLIPAEIHKAPAYDAGAGQALILECPLCSYVFQHSLLLYWSALSFSK